MSSFTSDSKHSRSGPSERVSGVTRQNHDRQSRTDDLMAATQASAAVPDQTVTTFQRMTSATLGSLVTSLLVTPLDVVRVRLQSQTSTPSTSPSGTPFRAHAAAFEKLPQNLGVTACCREVFWVGDNGQFCLAGNSQSVPGAAALHGSDCAVEERQRKTFTSTLDGLRKIAKNEGPTTLWRGLSPTLIMAIPANVIYFTGYDWLRYSSASPVRKVANDTYSPLVAGSVARVAAAVVVSPIEMFRTRMQAASGNGTGLFRSTLNGLYTMTQSQGYTSLWRGLTLTMWRDVPFSGIYWWGYEAVRNAITDSRAQYQHTTKPPHVTADVGLITPSRSRQMVQAQQPHMATFVDSFVAGSVSGAVAALITTPFDVGKTRQQIYRDTSGTAQLASHAVQRPPEQLSMPRFLLHILRNEGAKGLFKGWAARCLKVAPSCGIMISSYELGKKWAQSVNERSKEEDQI